MVMGIPPFCMTKSEVTRMKAAQPFMLMVVQMGSTNRDTPFRMPNRSSAVSMVTGSVPALLFVKSAISTAGIILAKTRIGFCPLAKRNSGNMMKNWMRFPPSITTTYLPMESATMPADTCAANWAEKATMPRGGTPRPWGWLSMASGVIFSMRMAPCATSPTQS